MFGRWMFILVQKLDLLKVERNTSESRREGTYNVIMMSQFLQNLDRIDL